MKSFKAEEGSNNIPEQLYNHLDIIVPYDPIPTSAAKKYINHLPHLLQVIESNEWVTINNFFKTNELLSRVYKDQHNQYLTYYDRISQTLSTLMALNSNSSDKKIKIMVYPEVKY